MASVEHPAEPISFYERGEEVGAKVSTLEWST